MYAAAALLLLTSLLAAVPMAGPHLTSRACAFARAEDLQPIPRRIHR
jgi:hypothetical protein